MREYRNTRFLLQSKNPGTFLKHNWPQNVILGTTIETNRDTQKMGVSLAPEPFERYKQFVQLRHHRKAVTVEPVIDFDLGMMLAWIIDINPVWVQIGYDTRKTGLREPPLWKVDALVSDLHNSGIPTHTKLLREPI